MSNLGWLSQRKQFQWQNMSWQFSSFFMPKKRHNENRFFLLNFLLFGSIYIPNCRKFYQRFGFCQFSSFLVNFGCFLVRKPKNAEIQKNVFCWIFFCWEAFTSQISEISSNGLDFANFLHKWSILAVFLAKKCQNRKTVFVVEFSFVGKHLHTKFLKILSNGLDFANFLHIWSILAVFFAKKWQIRKLIFLLNFLLLGSIYIPNFGKHLHTKFQNFFIKRFGFCQFS